MFWVFTNHYASTILTRVGVDKPQCCCEENSNEEGGKSDADHGSWVEALDVHDLLTDRLLRQSGVCAFGDAVRRGCGAKPQTPCGIKYCCLWQNELNFNFCLWSEMSIAGQSCQLAKANARWILFSPLATEGAPESSLSLPFHPRSKQAGYAYQPRVWSTSRAVRHVIRSCRFGQRGGGLPGRREVKFGVLHDNTYIDSKRPSRLTAALGLEKVRCCLWTNLWDCRANWDRAVWPWKVQRGPTAGRLPCRFPPYSAWCSTAPSGHTTWKKRKSVKAPTHNGKKYVQFLHPIDTFAKLYVRSELRGADKIVGVSCKSLL